MSDTLRVSFPKQNQTDTTVALNGVNYAQPMTDMQMYASFGETFFAENDVNGKSNLCATKVLDKPMTITYNDGQGNYDVAAVPFVPIYLDFVGGHPHQRPIFRPATK